VLGSALFLPLQGISTFTAPEEGQAYLAGIEEYDKLPPIFADTVFAVSSSSLSSYCNRLTKPYWSAGLQIRLVRWH